MAEPVCARPGTHGFSMIELVVVLTVALVLLGVATPRLLDTNRRLAVGSARSKVTAQVALTRAAATRFGRTSKLVLDAAGDRLSILVDTSALGDKPAATLQLVSLWDDLRVDLSATQPLICFDPRGLAVQSGACAGQPVVVYLRSGPELDSVVVSVTGRVTP
jgi:prepilin-type N-terminal cleavage/methylation domain-containing protein